MTRTLLSRFIIAFLLGALLSACFHNGTSMVKGQLTSDRNQSAPILKKIETYKTTHGYYPASLKDINLGNDYRIPFNTTYERYLVPTGSKANEDGFTYQLNTSWRIYSGHCRYDSQTQKWACNVKQNSDYSLATPIPS